MPATLRQACDCFYVRKQREGEQRWQSQRQTARTGEHEDMKASVRGVDVALIRYPVSQEPVD